MKLPNEYADDLLVRMAHHSSSIENNTISLAETVSILLHNTIPNKVSLREFYEVENHRYALDYLLENANLKKEVSFDTLFQTHRLLLDRLHHERGKFKSTGNEIKGADFETATVEQTPTLMMQWVDNINYRINLNLSKADMIKLACESHIEFERIHPFLYGNGRTGRLIMSYLLLKENIAPLIIEKKEKEEYIFYLATQDVKGFTSFAQQKIEKEEKRIRSFKLKEHDPFKEEPER